MTDCNLCGEEVAFFRKEGFTRKRHNCPGQYSTLKAYNHRVKCKCRVPVHFYQLRDGRKVLFDDLAPSWSKHFCGHIPSSTSWQDNGLIPAIIKELTNDSDRITLWYLTPIKKQTITLPISAESRRKLIYNSLAHPKHDPPVFIEYRDRGSKGEMTIHTLISNEGEPEPFSFTVRVGGTQKRKFEARTLRRKLANVHSLTANTK